MNNPLQLEAHTNAMAWHADLCAALEKAYGKSVYWINTETKLPPRDTLFNGWFHAYARPGNNEAHVCCLDWVAHPKRDQRDDSVTVLRMLTVKTESGLDHALEIAAWLTRATYACQVPETV